MAFSVVRVTDAVMSARLASSSGSSTTRRPNCRAVESQTKAACVPAFSLAASAASVTVGNEAALAASMPAQWPDFSSIFLVFLPTPASGSHSTKDTFSLKTSPADFSSSPDPGLTPSTTFHVATLSASATSPSERARSANEKSAATYTSARGRCAL